MTYELMINYRMKVHIDSIRNINPLTFPSRRKWYRSFSSDVTAAILVYQNNEMAAILVYGTGISSFLFKYFVLFHHPTGVTDHVSENDLLNQQLRNIIQIVLVIIQDSIYIIYRQ